MCVLLDGLDEVAVLNLRKDIVREVGAFAKSHEGNRFVITSRTVGYREARLKDHFSHLLLDPFSEGDIKFFIERWCDAVDLGGDKEAEKAALSDAIFESPRVVALAQNPLFVTILARVHRTYRYLPRTKPLLYGKCVEALLTTMDMNRNMPPVFPDDRTANRVMGPLALWMHAEKKGQFVSRKELVARLIKSDCWPQTEDEAGDLLWRIEERSGLLIQRGPDRFAFCRLPFQEYYAAKHLVSQMKQIETVENYVSDPWWRQILIMIAGLLDDVGQPYVAPYLNRALDLVKIESGSGSDVKRPHFEPGLAIAVASALDQVEAGQAFIDRLGLIMVELARRDVGLYPLDLRKLADVPAGKTISERLMNLVTGRDTTVQRQAVLYLYHMQGSSANRVRILLDVAPQLLDKEFQLSAYAQLLRLARDNADRPTLQKMRGQIRALPDSERVSLFHRQYDRRRDRAHGESRVDARWLRTQLALTLEQTVKRRGSRGKKGRDKRQR